MKLERTDAAGFAEAKERHARLCHLRDLNAAAAYYAQERINFHTVRQSADPPRVRANRSRWLRLWQERIERWIAESRRWSDAADELERACVEATRGA